VDLGRAERQQPFDLPRLILGVEVEVQARRDLQGRSDLVEREVRPHAVLRSQQHEVVVVRLMATLVAEGRLPELRLAL
jgi:hypothetical protein